MKIEPLRDMVLLQLRAPASPIGSILLPNRKEPTVWADVLATGPECTDTHEGDIVLVSLLAGTEIGSNLLLPESAILAFEEPTDAA